MSSEIDDKDTKEEGNDSAGPSEGQLPFYKVEWLDLSKDGIEAKQKKHMARALENGEFKNLKSLCLHNNAGDIGVRAMLNALQGSYLQTVEKLILWNVSSYDQITAAEEGTDTIANAIANNSLSKLHTLDMTGSLPKLISPRPWTKVFSDLLYGSLGAGRLQKFKNVFKGCCCTCSTDPPGMRPSTLECCCHLCGNYIYSGNDGLRKLVTALSLSSPPRALQVLNLRDNHIGDEGVKDLAQILSKGVLPLLEEVDLRHNPVSEEGEKMIVRAYLENPLLTANVMLDWTDPVLKERSSALREKNLRLEHRLTELVPVGIKMEHGNISESYEWKPDYSIDRPSKKEPYRFRMHCQNGPCETGNAGAKGIPIKEKPFFSMPLCCASPSRKLVHRVFELEEVPPTTDDSKADTAAPGLAVPRAEKNLSTTHEDSRPPVAREGKARISVTPGTSCFITVAKFQKKSEEERAKSQKKSEEERAKSQKKSEEERAKSQKKSEEEREEVNTKIKVWFLKRLPFVKWEKSERQIDAIIMELLMFADRKPREFQEMFGLTRVLLEDSGGCHYPAYVCETCRVQPRDAGKSLETVVKQLSPTQQLPIASASAAHSA